MGVTSNVFLAIFLKALVFPLTLLSEALNNVVHWFYKDSYVSGKRRKAVLITGCDSGFGAEAVSLFAQKGVPVFAGCITPEAIQRWSEVEQSNIKPLTLDITVEESVQNAKSNIESTCADEKWEFWGLVCNAGVINEPVRGDWFTYEDCANTVNVNLLGQIRTVLSFLPLIKQSRGRISVTSSIAAHIAPMRFCPYAASKFGVRGFAESLRVGLRKSGVKIALVAPEYYPTNIVTTVTLQMIEEKWHSLSEELKKEYPLEKELSDVAYMQEKKVKAANRNRISDVAEVYFDAIYNVRPRLHYYVGHDTFLHQLMMIVPDFVAEWIIERSV